jgi:hypothetical protein
VLVADRVSAALTGASVLLALALLITVGIIPRRGAAAVRCPDPTHGFRADGQAHNEHAEAVAERHAVA